MCRQLQGGGKINEMADTNELTPVQDLPWYETLRVFLEPYQPAYDFSDSTKQFSSREIIQAIESHHGVPQGIVGKETVDWISPEDFVMAMRKLGFREANITGNELEWIMKKI